MSSRERQTHPTPAPVSVPSESLLQLMDISAEALVVVDQAGSIVMTNEQMGVLFAYGREEMVGQPLEMQGGEIQVESEPGHGSTFRFTLPAFLPTVSMTQLK